MCPTCVTRNVKWLFGISEVNPFSGKLCREYQLLQRYDILNCSPETGELSLISKLSVINVSVLISALKKLGTGLILLLYCFMSNV